MSPSVRCPKENLRSAICQTMLRATSRNEVSQSESEGTPQPSSEKGVIRSNYAHISRPVGSGKTALTLALCRRLRKEFNIGEHNIRNYPLTPYSRFGFLQQL